MKNDRRRQVATTRLKNNERLVKECKHEPRCVDWYKHISKLGGEAAQGFKAENMGKVAAMIRWHPYMFENGTVLPEFEPYVYGDKLISDVTGARKR